MNISYALLRAYSFVLRRLTPNSGLTPLAFNKVTKRLFANIPASDMTRTLEGVPIEARVNDYHGRILWLFGSNDFKVARTAKALMSDGGVFLDIGANYSTIGLAVACDRTKTSDVHLFEPQPYLAEIVTNAIKAGNLSDRVKLHQLALFDSEGSFEMVVPQHHSGMASMVKPEGFTKQTDTIRIPAVKTSDFVTPLIQGRPMGVKIDVEGAEPNILPDLIAMPELRFCIFEGANNESTLFDLFRDANMQMFGLCRNIFSVALEPVHNMDDFNRFHDFVAIATSRKVPEGQLDLAALRALLD